MGRKRRCNSQGEKLVDRAVGGLLIKALRNSPLNKAQQRSLREAIRYAVQQSSQIAYLGALFANYLVAWFLEKVLENSHLLFLFLFLFLFLLQLFSSRVLVFYFFPFLLRHKLNNVFYTNTNACFHFSCLTLGDCASEEHRKPTLLQVDLSAHSEQGSC